MSKTNWFIILAGGVGLAALLLIAAVIVPRLSSPQTNPVPVVRQSWLSPIQEYVQNESLRASGNWISPIQEYALNLRSGAAMLESSRQNSQRSSSQAWKSPIEEYISHQ